MPRRRFVVAVAALIALPGAVTAPNGLRLRPEQDRPAPLLVEPQSGTFADTVFRLWIAGASEPIELPAARAHCLIALPIAGREVLAVAFAADLPSATTQDLVALIGWDGACLRILGIETLSWRRDDGAAFEMRLMATPDRMHLRLACLATMSRPVTRPFRLVWNDLLAWRDGAPLAAAAARPPLSGTWQAEQAAVRGRIADLLARPITSLTLDDLAGTGIIEQFGCMAGV